MHGAPLLATSSMASEHQPSPPERTTTTRNCLTVSAEGQEHWDANFVFRTLILGLHAFTMLLVSVMFFFPSIYSGCASFMGVFPTFIVCTCMPFGMWAINWFCNRKKHSKAKTKLALVTVMLAYYMAVVFSDAFMHIMVTHCCSVPPAGALRTVAAFVPPSPSHHRSASLLQAFQGDAYISSPACNLTFETLENHRDYELELSDFTFNFFLFSSIAESGYAS